MAEIEGYIRVYESSDGGTGKPCNTFWQFHIAAQPDVKAVITNNYQIAETMRFAVETNSKVRVTYDPDRGDTISQARIEFKYVCESLKIENCDGIPENICATRRFAPCDPN